jgi:Predicted ATPase
MIREVHINNYRSIQELSLGLKQINIIIGDNSTGKSSILEAIAIASTAPIYRDCISNNILEHIAKRRGKPYYTNLQHLVRNGADYAEITVTDEETTSTVEIYYITKDNSYLLEEDNVLKRLMMLAVHTVISSVQTELDTTQLSRAVNPVMDTDLLSKIIKPETHALALIRSKDFDIKTYVLAVYNYIISDGEEVAVGKLLRLLFIDRLIDVNTVIETQLRNLLHNININNIKIDDIKDIITDINGTILFKTSTGNIPINMLGIVQNTYFAINCCYIQQMQISFLLIHLKVYILHISQH